MHPSAVTDGHNGISQAQFAQLVSKTDMGRIERLVSENGADAWRRFVKMHGKSLVKESTTTGITTGLGLNFIDLRAPAYMLDPIFSHIRNTTPRWDKVNAGYGVQPQWKAVVAIDASQQFPGVSEGNTNANGQFSLLNFSSPYVTLGTDDFVTYESISASEGYEDSLGDGKMWQLLRFIRMQERSYLGGAGTTASNGALQIGTTNTPTAALTALSNASNNATNLPTGAYAAAYAVALNYRAAINPNNTVSAGITTQYLRTNADGSSDVINGGTAIVSPVSNVAGPTTSPLKNVLFYATPKAGAWGYAWFVEVNASSSFTPAAASAKLTGITIGQSYFVYTGQTQGTQTAAYAGSGGYAGFATDLSTNALDMDGLLTIASNSAYMTGLPVPTFTLNSWGTALGTNGWDNHGAGLTNGGLVGSITEIDTVLFQIQQAALTGPTKIYLSSDQVPAFRSAFMVGSSSSTAVNYFFPNGGPNTDGSGIAVNGRVAQYHNIFGLPGGEFVDVIQHPYLPAGTILFDVDKLQETYANSRLGETRGVFVRRDTYGIEFAQTSRKYPFGVFSEEVLAVKTPNLIAFITGLGKFGATNVF
jgi:hypothetical protein